MSLSGDFEEKPPDTVKAVVYCGRGLKSRKNDKMAAKVVFGIDNDRRKTNVVHDNNPVWNEEGEFKVNKSDKAVVKFKLYDGDEVIGVVKIPVSELSEKPQVRPMELEPYKKSQPQPSGELQISAFIKDFKTATNKRRSSTLGHKIKAKLGSNLDITDNMSTVSGESKSSTSKMSTMKRKILGKKDKDSKLRGAQSMLSLGDPGGWADQLNPEMFDRQRKTSFDLRTQTLPPPNYQKSALAAVDNSDKVSQAGSEQSSIPGSAASLERKKNKEKSLVKAFKKPFGKKSTLDKQRSLSMFNVSDLPTESWHQKMEHRLTADKPEPDAEDQGISMEYAGSETSNFSQPMQKELSTSNSNLPDSGMDIRDSTNPFVTSSGAVNTNPFTSPSTSSTANVEEKPKVPASRKSSNAPLPPVLITDIIPNKGSDNGGTKVSIIGSNFGSCKEDIKTLKICGCDVLKSVQFLSSSKITVTTSMWNTGSGPVEIELSDGRQCASKQKYEFVRANKLTEEAKNLPVPSMNSAATPKYDKNPNKPTNLSGSTNSLLDAKRKFSYSTLGLDRIASPEPKQSPLTPTKNAPSSDKLDQLAVYNSTESVKGSRTSLYRKHSDRVQHEQVGGFQTKKELEEEITRLKELVDELTQQNVTVNQYLEDLLVKVMEKCPEVLQT